MNDARTSRLDGNSGPTNSNSFMLSLERRRPGERLERVCSFWTDFFDRTDSLT